MEGWIKLHRKIKKSDMYQHLTAKQRDILIQCLLLANHQGKKWEWQGNIYECRPGEFITSLSSLTEECARDVRVRSVRTALSVLAKWGFLTSESTKTGHLIKIVNWVKYQDYTQKGDKEIDKEMTKDRQRIDKEVTTNNNDKNDNKYITLQSQIAKLAEKIKVETGKSVRTEVQFPGDWQDQVIDAYQKLKGIKLKGSEFLPIQQGIKTMLLDGRTPEEMIQAMMWFAKSTEDWTKNWTINTIRMKLPEILGKLEAQKCTKCGGRGYLVLGFGENVAKTRACPTCNGLKIVKVERIK